MSRYIDTDKLLTEFHRYALDTEDLHIDLIEDIVNDEPTADVVEVVRCKDCEHFEAINNDDHGWCKMISDLPCGISVRYDDDYCSYGERIEA